MHLVLFQPEIPGNTGNIIRLCANTGTQLHLIEPLGFALDDSKLKRAGLDYHEWASLKVHRSWSDFLQAYPQARIFAFSARATHNAFAIQYRPDDVLLFGPESQGLPADLMATLTTEQLLRLPMRAGRSLNLSNAAAVVVYEAWRQQNFVGAEGL